MIVLALYYIWQYLPFCVIINDFFFICFISVSATCAYTGCVSASVFFSTGNVNMSAWVWSTFPGCAHPQTHPFICVGFTIMFCYCFVAIFATALALPFSFHPPFSCALPGKCGLTETIPRDIAICSSVTGYNLSGNVHGAGEEAACGRNAVRTRRVPAAHPHQPAHQAGEGCATSQGMGVVWLEGFGARAWVHNFWALLLPLCRARQVRLVPPCTRLPAAQRGGLQTVFGRRPSLWAPLEAEVGKGICQHVYLSLCRVLLHVKYCGAETKLPGFLGKP